MARGWESKSVESQIEEFQQAKPAHGQTAEERLRQQERASIELTRTRVLHDLEAATHPRYREQLKAALSHLDQRLAAIEAGNSA